MGRPRKMIEPVVMVEDPDVIDDVIVPEVPEVTDGMVTIKNEKPGFTLHLGDGRKLAFGESAEVQAYIAAAING